MEVLDAVLRYEDGASGAQREERVFVGAKSTEDVSAIAQGRVKEVEEAFARAKDAAATLEKIEIERLRNATNHIPMPSPPRHGSDGSLGEPPRVPPPLTALAPKAHSSPEAQRRAHDQAIRNFQAY